MKHFLLSLIKDLGIAAFVILFLYLFASYAQVDDYLLKTTLAPVMDQYRVDSEAMEFTYVFPLRFKVRGIVFGQNSFIKEIDLMISPLTFFRKNSVSLLNLRVREAIIDSRDLDSFAKSREKKSGSGLDLDIYSFRLEDIYLTREDDFVKIEEAVMGISLGESRSVSLRSLKGETSLMESRFSLRDGDFTDNRRNSTQTLFLRGTINEGDFLFEGRVKSGDLSARLSLERLDLEYLSEGLSGYAGIRGKLQGTLDSPRLTGDIFLDNVRFRQFVVQNGQYGVSLTPERLSFPHIYATTGEGTLTGNLDINLGRAKSLEGDFTFEKIDFHEVIENFPLKTKLNGKIRLQGETGIYQDFNGTVTLKDLSGTIEDEDVSRGEVDFIKKGDLFRIERARAGIGAGEVSFQGDYYRNYYNFDLELDTIALEKIFPRSLTKGSVNFKGVVNKDEKGFSVMGYASVDNFSYKEALGVENINIFLSAGEKMTANLFYSGLSLKGKALSPSGKMDLFLEDKGTLLSVRSSRFLIKERAAATFDFSASHREGRWRIQDMENKVEIGGESLFFGVDEVTLEGKKADINGFYIKHRASEIGLSLSFDRAWEDSNVDLQGTLDLKELNGLFRILPDISGKVSLETVKKPGRRPEIRVASPSVEVQLSDFETMSYENISLAWHMEKNEVKVTELSFDVSGETNLLKGRALLGRDGNPLVLDSFELEGDLKKVHSAYLVNLATRDASVTSGYFSGPVHLLYDGRFHLDANVALEETQLIIFGLGDVFIHNLRGDALIRDNRITINMFRGDVGEGGKFFFSGKIKDFIYDLSFDFKISFEDAVINNLWYFSGMGSGEITLKTVDGHTAMSGEVRVDNGLVAGEFGEMFAARDFLEIKGMDMNVHILADNNVWLKNSMANLELSTDFYYKRERKTDQVFFSGSIQTLKGTVRFLNVPFQVRDAVLAFSNSPEVLPSIDVTAETYVIYKDRIRIELDVTGDIQNPVVRLSADDPTLTREDIISLLTFNRPAYDMAGEDAVAQKVGELATDYLQNKLFSPLRESQWVDSFSVRGNILTAEDPYLDLQIGKYIRSNLYLSYQDEILSGDSRRFDFIYYFNKNLSLQTGAAEEEGDFTYNIDFKIKFKY